MADIDLQEFGRLQAEVAGLRRDNDRQLELLEKLTTEVAGMRKDMAEATGGWRMLMAMGGVAAAAGSALTWVVQHFISRGAP